MSLLSPARDLYAVVWERPFAERHWATRWLIHTARILWVVGRDLAEGKLNLQAMSLVYTTLLSLVPALAIGFAVFRTFGYDAYLKSFLIDFLAPLGDRGTEITQTIIGFVDRVDVGLLGSVGVAMLIYTVVTMILKVEFAFNQIWHVQTGRSLAQRVKDIVSMGVLGPIVFFGVLSIFANVLSNSLAESAIALEPVRTAIDTGRRIVPYVIVVAGFTLLYAFVPNTRVKFPAALAGALVAGIAWSATGWVFAAFIVSSARYIAIYSAFASLFFFMIWLYLAWLILLIGCSVAYYVHNIAHLSPIVGVVQLTQRQTERLALQALLLVYKAFGEGRQGWNETELSAKLNLPNEALDQLLARLMRGQFLSVAENRRLVPTKPARLVRIADVIRLAHYEDTNRTLPDRSLPHDAAVELLFAEIGEAQAKVVGEMTLADLLEKAEKYGFDDAPPKPRLAGTPEEAPSQRSA